MARAILILLLFHIACASHAQQADSIKPSSLNENSVQHSNVLHDSLKLGGMDTLAKQQIQKISAGIKNETVSKIADADSLLKHTATETYSKLKSVLPDYSNIDSNINSQLKSVSANVINQVKKSVTTSITNIRKNLTQLPELPKINGDAIKKLKRFKFYNAVASVETNEWDNGQDKNIYLQKIISSDANIAGIPVTGDFFITTNYFNGQKAQRIVYKLNYTRDGLMDKLKINKDEMKNQLTEKLDFDKQVNYKQMITDAFSNIPTVNELLATTNCNWQDLQEMPQETFSKIYNKDSLNSKLSDALLLKRYYDDYAAQAKNAGDSLLLAKQKEAGDSVEKVKQQSALYEKLGKLKKTIDKVQAEIAEARKIYNEKLKEVVEGYNVVSGAIKNNKDLSGLQKFMTKVKGLKIGQHSLSVGTIVLQNYLQNGVSFEYETDATYLLLTKGSQKNIDYPGYFFQNTSATQAGLDEYYQYNSKYMLTGVSFGRGNKDANCQQVSFMNFKKVNNAQNPSLLSKNINVVTIGNKLSLNGKKIDLEISKSFVKQTSENRQSNTSDADDGSFFQSIGLGLKYQNENNLLQERHKLELFYSNPEYNNPGLNGGILRPGIQFNDKYEKQVSKKIKFSNQGGYYAFKYGNGVSVKSIRDKIGASYKIKRIKLGILFYGSYDNQAQEAPKTIYKTKSYDLLATSQASVRAGRFAINTSQGVGFGKMIQDKFNESKDFSFFLNSTVNYKSFSLDVNMDKFNTSNTEVFLSDSSALILSSNFNLDAALSIVSPKGNFFQAGVSYKKFNNTGNQFFLTAGIEWQLFNHITVSGNLNWPISSPTSAVFANNLFNSKLIYNLKRHEK